MHNDDPRSRLPTDFNRVPRKRELKVIIWVLGVIGVAAIVALAAAVRWLT